MSTKSLVAKAAAADEYWRNVAIQDRFWIIIFPDFVKPLQELYLDPTFAGLHILSSYMANPDSTALQFTSDPSAFGPLIRQAPSLSNARTIYSLLASRPSGPTFETCVTAFVEQRNAGEAMKAFASVHPKLYRELQKARKVRRSAPSLPSPRIIFFGKPVSVSDITRLATRRKRQVKIKL